LPARAEAAAAGFQPARHTTDDWLDVPKGGHRMVIDSSTADGAARHCFIHEFLHRQQSGLQSRSAAIAVVVVLRHFSTPSHTRCDLGEIRRGVSEITNSRPKEQGRAHHEFVQFGRVRLALTNFGNTISSLVQKNVQFAVCNVATRFFAGVIADKTKGSRETASARAGARIRPPHVRHRIMVDASSGRLRPRCLCLCGNGRLRKRVATLQTANCTFFCTSLRSCCRNSSAPARTRPNCTIRGGRGLALWVLKL